MTERTHRGDVACGIRWDRGRSGAVEVGRAAEGSKPTATARNKGWAEREERIEPVELAAAAEGKSGKTKPAGAAEVGTAEAEGSAKGSKLNRGCRREACRRKKEGGRC